MVVFLPMFGLQGKGSLLNFAFSSPPPSTFRRDFSSFPPLFFQLPRSFVRSAAAADGIAGGMPDEERGSVPVFLCSIRRWGIRRAGALKSVENS